MMNKKICRLMAVVALVIGARAAFGGPVLHTSDFIADGDRTNFVDFEPLGFASGLGNTFTQDGVTITQVNGDVNNISTVCRISLGCWFTNNTANWYPSGGDGGWTEISRANGLDFFNVGLDLGSGYGSGSHTIWYEVFKNGLSLLFGSITTPSLTDGYIGFSGGGFDLIRLQNTSGVAFTDTSSNALAIDNVELSGQVPAPATLALFSLGLVGLGWSRRKIRGA